MNEQFRRNPVTDLPDDTVSVLYVDSDVERAQRTAEVLERTAGSVRVRTTRAVRGDAVSRNGHDVDCVVVRYDGTAAGRRTVLDFLSRDGADHPSVVVVADDDSEAVVADVFEAGATAVHRTTGDTVRAVELAAQIRTAVTQARTNAKLRRCERRLARHESILDSVRDAVWATDPDGRLVYANDHLCEQVDRVLEDLLGRHYSEVLSVDTHASSDGVAAFSALVDSVLEGHSPMVRTELEFADDGETVVHEIQVVPLETGDELRGAVGLDRDVTERRLREDEYRDLVERTTDGIVDVAADWVVTGVEGGTDDADGVDFESLRGRDFLGVFVTEFGTASEPRYRAVMDSRTPDSFEDHLEAVDRWYLVDAYPGPDDGLTLYFHDVHEEKARSREFERWTTLLEAMTEATIDGLLVVDERRNVLQYNHRFLDVWGLSEGDVVRGGTDPLAEPTLLDAVLDGAGFVELVESVYESPATTAQAEFGLADGRWVDLYSAPVLDGAGTYYGRLWVSRDVTDRRVYARELEVQTERLESFTSIVSHDLRNPLQVATGWLEVARADSDSSALARVAHAHERMNDLIDDLLVLARTNSALLETEALDLGAQVYQCWQNVETGDAVLRVASNRTVVADPTQLGQLLENLVRNAIEHNRPVDPETGARSDRPLTVTVGSTADGFFVEDDGVGIPESERERVFESGFSTTPGGTGFGLAIVERIADAHGWAVRVTESDAGGARFEFDVAADGTTDAPSNPE